MKLFTIKNLILANIYFFCVITNVFASETNCNFKKEICFWKEKIVGIKTPMMIASGIILRDDFIITNRHVIEDHDFVLVKKNNGKIKKAFPLYHNIPADLVILTLNKQNKKYKDIIIETFKPDGEIRVIAFDQGRNNSRIYKSGKIISNFDLSHVKSRIHTTAKSFPGNSGGAVVDEKGNLIGVLASGDGKINEVIPIYLVNNIIKNIDIKHKENFIKIGYSIRKCADNLHTAHNIPKLPKENIVNGIINFCNKSNNKQLYDEAGQTFGRWGNYKESARFLEESIKMDPNSPNALLSLAITYHLDRRIKDELPIIKKLIELVPSNPQMLRLAVQVSGFLKDKKLANEVLNLIKLHNPNEFDLANKFLNNAFAK